MSAPVGRTRTRNSSVCALDGHGPPLLVHGFDTVSPCEIICSYVRRWFTIYYTGVAPFELSRDRVAAACVGAGITGPLKNGQRRNKLECGVRVAFAVLECLSALERDHGW